MDQTIFSFIHGFAGRHVLTDDALIFFARWVPYLLVIGFFFLLVGVKGFRIRLLFFIEAALAGLLARGLIAEAIYFFYARPRPFEALGFDPLVPHPANPSFPSGHVTFYIALACVVYAVNRRWGIAYFVLASLMALSRIGAGVHWPTDVLAGAVIGLASGWFVLRLLRQFEPLAGGPAEGGIINETQG